MGKYRLFVITAAFLCGGILHGGEAGLPGIKKKSWSYTPISINSTTSDDSKFKADVSVERISRNQLGLVGTMLLNYEANDDSTEIDLLSYRSALNKIQWKNLAFALQRQTLTEFMNGFYKQMLMSSLKGCSNFPIFSVFKVPFPKNIYNFEKCIISIDNFPDHMQDGYYKLDLYGHGKVEWNIQFIVKIEKAD